MKITEFQNVQKFKFHSDDTSSDDVRIRELNWLAPYIPNWGLNLEFGVFSGLTINTVAKARPDLTFDGFDSFEGLPEDWDTGAKYVKKEFFNRKGNLPEVESNVNLHEGWFDATLPSFLEERSDNVGYLHIDCDVYSSTVTILENCNDRIVPGTIIRWDELACWRSVFGEASPNNKANRALYSTWPEHEWKAMLEWMDKYDRKVMPISRNWFQGATVIVTQ